jgi:hypothetical protein
MDAKQKSMLGLRLGLLDSYLTEKNCDITCHFKEGQMVIVDLTDPFLDGERPRSELNDRY